MKGREDRRRTATANAVFRQIQLFQGRAASQEKVKGLCALVSNRILSQRNLFEVEMIALFQATRHFFHAFVFQFALVHRDGLERLGLAKCDDYGIDIFGTQLHLGKVQDGEIVVHYQLFDTMRHNRRRLSRHDLRRRGVDRRGIDRIVVAKIVATNRRGTGGAAGRAFRFASSAPPSPKGKARHSGHATHRAKATHLTQSTHIGRNRIIVGAAHDGARFRIGLGLATSGPLFVTLEPFLQSLAARRRGAFGIATSRAFSQQAFGLADGVTGWFQTISLVDQVLSGHVIVKGEWFPFLASSEEFQDAAMSPDAGATSAQTMISAIFFEFLSAQDLAVDFQKGNGGEASRHFGLHYSAA
mmetsp:Transcript_37350/g.57950  ORF Transcript_37350/g.57950 Transcript_37350/m.57950 type:complete len:357 (-) Transcript_37350:82-1152(-)